MMASGDMRFWFIVDRNFTSFRKEKARSPSALETGIVKKVERRIKIFGERLLSLFPANSL